MTYLLDTNACISYLRQPAPSKIATKLASLQPADVALCAVVSSIAGSDSHVADRAVRVAEVAAPQGPCCRYGQLRASQLAFPSVHGNLAPR